MNTNNKMKLVGGNKPSMVGVKKKKKVWEVKKKGWKMVEVDKPTSTNIHTKKHNIQPTSTQKPTSESKHQQTNFKKWLVTPKLNVGGGGQISDIREVSSSEILEKESSQNIHIDYNGFNNPGPDGQYPAKTDGD